MERTDCRVGPPTDPAFRPTRGVEIFSQGGNQQKLVDHRQADRRQGPVVLRDGRFPVRLHTDDMKAAFIVDRFPPKKTEENPASPGTFSRSLGTFGAGEVHRYPGARACAWAAKAVLLPATVKD